MLYHTGKDQDDQTDLAKASADQWKDCHTVSRNEEFLAALTDDQPDVIYYPEIGMDPVTLFLAARRLAPLQIAGWGHPITTGLPEIDLFMSGELLESEGADNHYRERLIRLPGTGCCTTQLEISAEALPQQLYEDLASRLIPCS